jgi:hypothetical protein
MVNETAPGRFSQTKQNIETESDNFKSGLDMKYKNGSVCLMWVVCDDKSIPLLRNPSKAGCHPLV